MRSAGWEGYIVSHQEILLERFGTGAEPLKSGSRVSSFTEIGLRRLQPRSF